MESKKARANVPHSVIFEHWRDAIITETGKVLVEGEDTSEPFVEVIEDERVPCCWACELPVEIEDDVRLAPSAIWNRASVKAHLQRCHIHPHALGGSDTPDNLFLMCRMCHNDSPDTTNRATFFRWVFDRRMQYNQGVRKVGLVYKDLIATCERRGIELIPLLQLAFENQTEFSGADKVEMLEYIHNNTVSHGYDGASSSGRLSFYEAVVDWLTHRAVTNALK